MSHRRTLTMVCAVLGAALVQTMPALAQPTTPPPAADQRSPGAGPTRRAPPSADQRVARMTTELGLSTDQATRVRTALTAEQRGIDSALARRTAARDAERAAMTATQTTMQKALAGILTPDQKIRHDAMRARQGGHRGMRHRDSDTGPRGGRADGRGNRGDRRGPPNGDRRGPPNGDTTTR